MSARATRQQVDQRRHHLETRAVEELGRDVGLAVDRTLGECRVASDHVEDHERVLPEALVEVRLEWRRGSPRTDTVEGKLLRAYRRKVVLVRPQGVDGVLGHLTIGGP